MENPWVGSIPGREADVVLYIVLAVCCIMYLLAAIVHGLNRNS